MRKRMGNRKKPGRGGQRRRRRGSRVAADGDSEDEVDKEYVAGEDEDEYDEEEEEEEEEEESDDDDEEEFQFSDSSSGDGGGGSDEEEEADFDDDEEEGGDDDDNEVDLVQVSRSRRRRSAGNSRSRSIKSRAPNLLRKKDVQYPLVEVSRSKPPKVASCSKRSVRKRGVWDVRIKEGEDEEVQNDLVDLPRSKRKRAAAVPKRSARKFRVSDDEYDEDEDDSKRKKKNGIRSRKDVDEDEDYKEDLEEEYDDEEEDLTLDELDEDDVSLISPEKHVNDKKRKSISSYHKNARKRRKVRLEEEDYDDDFFVKKDHPGDSKREKKNHKKVKNSTKRNLTSRTNRKNSPALDSETSDFDYVTSDDDFEVKDWNMLDKQRNRIKKERRKPADLAGRRRKRSSIGSDTSSSDSDFEISEEELRELGIGGVLNRPQPKRVFAEKKGEEKGKEKVIDEAGKQVCGICLYEEQRTTVQGILNCCIHYFCFACIMEWSKVESRCPLCKRRFGTITKSSRSYPGFGLRKSVIKVEKRDQVYQPSEEEIRRILDPYENVVCIECQQGGEDSLMLLCDICDSSAHTYCVGLGREVPEGNWYCECCRSVADISSNATNQASRSDDGPSNGTFQNHGIEREENKREVSATPTPQQPIPLTGQPSVREFDLNVSPRPEEDNGIVSQASGVVAATVSGRRAIRQHIRLRFFSTRLSQTSAANDLAQHNAESGIINPGAEQNEQSLHGSISAQHNDRSFFQSNYILAPCQESSFRCEEGAKARVYSIVKRHLEELSTDSQLEHSTFKKIARRSTHTILAAYGIKHKKKLVVGSFRPPSSCSHISEDSSPFFIHGCCSSCFTSFAANIVSDILCKAPQR